MGMFGKKEQVDQRKLKKGYTPPEWVASSRKPVKKEVVDEIEEPEIQENEAGAESYPEAGEKFDRKAHMKRMNAIRMARIKARKEQEEQLDDEGGDGASSDEERRNRMDDEDDSRVDSEVGGAVAGGWSYESILYRIVSAESLEFLTIGQAKMVSKAFSED